jgi:7,8-dihydropterin-6-yl-methyl-4-(beta-D-ribofuranosyl)aminobenzene 5'-phosphate synthase
MVRIDDELILFGNVKGDKLVPRGNEKLLKEYSNGIIDKDNFEHEINLLINENGKYSLFCGCAHRGIVNIVEKAKYITNGNVNAVVGGFHLIGMNVKNSNTKEFLSELSTVLKDNNVDKYYTCHCTGEQAYDYLKHKMDNLSEVKTGMVIEI